MSLSLDKNDIKQKISKVSTKTDLETFRLQFLGKKGFLTQEMKSLSSLSMFSESDNKLASDTFPIKY